MALQPMGASFAPTSDNAQMAGKTAGTAPSFSRPIQTLNFRLPKVTNAPSPLLSQERAGSGIGGAVLQSVLKTVLGVDAASQLPMGGGGRDNGQDILQALSGSMRPPQTDQAPQSSAPMPMGPSFEGNIDTPPQQNGPPQFDGGGGNFNAYDALTMPDDEQRRALLALLSNYYGNAPHAPAPNVHVENPTGGGSYA